MNDELVEWEVWTVGGSMSGEALRRDVNQLVDDWCQYPEKNTSWGRQKINRRTYLKNADGAFTWFDLEKISAIDIRPIGQKATQAGFRVTS